MISTRSVHPAWVSTLEYRSRRTVVAWTAWSLVNDPLVATAGRPSGAG
ncbi:hypothetical protein [Salana multivorans]|nr:hypothetical protein [Salana multivorans]